MHVSLYGLIRLGTGILFMILFASIDSETKVSATFRCMWTPQNTEESTCIRQFWMPSSYPLSWLLGVLLIRIKESHETNNTKKHNLSLMEFHVHASRLPDRWIAHFVWYCSFLRERCAWEQGDRPKSDQLHPAGICALRTILLNQDRFS